MIFTQTFNVPADRRVTLEIPREIPTEQVILTITPKTAVQEQKKERIPGCVKGQVWMADDFDAPLEDFKDYM